MYNKYDHGWRAILLWTIVAVFLSGFVGTVVYYKWTKFKFYMNSGKCD